MTRALLGLLAGCSQVFGLEPPMHVQHDAPLLDDTALADATIDGSTADARVCPPAPATCTVFQCTGSSSCYYACATKQNWSGAAASCVSASLGCIVTINDQAEQDCIAAASTPAFPDIVWFGFSQDPLGAEPAGGWEWECGSSTFLNSNWGMLEPNNYNANEDCGAMTGQGAWLDANCAGTARYVCELL